MPPGSDIWHYIRVCDDFAKRICFLTCVAQPIPGHAICNLGDAMSIFSGGILRSNLHRVVYVLLFDRCDAKLTRNCAARLPRTRRPTSAGRWSSSPAPQITSNSLLSPMRAPSSLRHSRTLRTPASTKPGRPRSPGSLGGSSTRGLRTEVYVRRTLDISSCFSQVH